ncbi:hypothetical protein HNV12_00570 [Methanococcoides sp. SA1]|nr:hypothetical protein [Methanococcoides sp. SA1]
MKKLFLVLLIGLFMVGLVSAAAPIFIEHDIGTGDAGSRSNIEDAEIIDFDDDGDYDILTSAQGSDEITWWNNTGDNVTFGDVLIYDNANTDGTTTLEVLDFDGDGDYDIVYGARSANIIGWLENNGTNTNFTDNLICASEADCDNVWSIQVLDWDNDGDYDIVGAMSDDDEINLFTNDGTNNSFAVTTIGSGADFDDVRYLKVVDLEGDGDYDVFYTASKENRIGFLRNDSGTFVDNQICESSTECDDPRDLEVMDFDNDGDYDVVSSASDDDQLFWYENNGDNSTFTRRLIASGGGAVDEPMHIDVLDYNNDGYNDVVVASYTDDRLGVWINNGNNIAFTETLIVDSVTTANGAFFVEAFDFDGDNDYDFLLSSHVTDRIALWETNESMPTLESINVSDGSSSFGAGATININATEENDAFNETLFMYCDSTDKPFSTNTDCTGGSTSGGAPYELNCSYAVSSVEDSYTEYCRVYDGFFYSDVSNLTYSVDAASVSTTVTSVAGDSAASYFDTTNNGRTDILVAGEEDMTCRYYSSDTAYTTGSGTACSVTGTQANCSVTDIASQGYHTRYVSCSDSAGNGQNTTQNLDVGFYLDYTAPTTNDNSNTDIQAPPYVVTISEADNVDGDVDTLYCLGNGCTPNLVIDDGGQVIFTSADRGVNYLRYYSIDDAGNSQGVVSKTININELPLFTSASDDAVIILGGTVVNVSTVSNDSDSGQQLTLWVCNSSGATFEGCTGVEYCNATGTANLSCAFDSESDSESHIWYAYLFDASDEEASNNPLSGSYTTDAVGPTITIVNPENISYTNDDITASIILGEVGSLAWYSLDGAANVTMNNVSSVSWVASILDLSLGQHNITFYANDTYGNIGVSAVRYFTISSPLDTTDPALTIISPLNGTYQGISGVLVNVSSDEDLSWAGYSLNGGSVSDLGNSSLTIWNSTLSGLSQETEYNLTVYGNDTSDNQGSSSVIFYADSLAPRYSSALATPSPANVSDSVNCSVFWNDSYSISSVKIAENSSGSFENHTIDFTGTSGNASYNIVGSKLSSAGTYSCIFYATDIAGNLNSTSVDFDVNDVTNPVITVLSPDNVTYNQESLDISISVSEAASWAGYSLGGAANVSMGNTSSTGWNASLVLSTGNSYSIIFYANDTSGNMASSAEIVFSVDTGQSDVVAPVVSVDSIINASYRNSTSVDLNVSVNENSSWAGYSLNGGGVVDMTNTSLLNWNASLSGLGDEATNTLVVYVNDTSGNQGNKTIVFYSDVLAPRYSSVSTSPSSANESDDVTCSVYWNDTFGFDSVKIAENSSGVFENHTIDLTSEGWANYTILSLDKGDYLCLFYVTDLAGNSNYTSTDFSVSDVTAPVVTINSPLNQTYSSDSILFSVSLNEDGGSVNYSLDGGASNTSLSGSGTSWSDTVVVGDGQSTVIFYASDSSGNVGSKNVSFFVDTSVNDITAPIVTVWSPVNASYDLDGSVLLNMTANENLSWAGYTNNSGSLEDLGNTSMTSWNSTVAFAEGTHEIIFYANDTSANLNQGNTSVTVYVDLTVPSVDNLSCTDVNDSADVNCTLNVSDAVGLDYVIFSDDSSGSFVNSSQVDLSGTSDLTNYIVSSSNHSPGSFDVRAYVFDLSGRVNGSEVDSVLIGDDTAPQIENVTYSPNVSGDLDPGVAVNVNATIVEDYNISLVYLMYKNSSAVNWTYVLMGNNSVLVDGSNSSVVYNGSFAPQAENWTFKVNATDYAGNVNVSSETEIEVSDDVSQNVSTTIDSVESITYAERTSNNSLGNLTLNNTGDTDLNFSVTISSSSIESRFSVNYTSNQTENYSVSSGGATVIVIDVNSSELTSGLYGYNVTVVSAAGTEIFERSLNVQTAVGPYLVASIDTYSSTVVAGQSAVELVVSVQNLGTTDATGVYLNWTLPSVFSLVSGSLNRSLGNLGVGVSGTNTITIDVSSSAADQTVSLVANATSSNADSIGDLKVVAIGSGVAPVVVIGGGGGGGSSGGGGGGGTAVVYDKVVEIVRGVDDGFDVEVQNIYSGAVLEGLSLDLSGFLEQYVSIVPERINQIEYGEEGLFRVEIVAPPYQEYAEYDLVAVITGKTLTGQAVSNYRETQNIKLIVQEISREDSEAMLIRAREAVVEMNERGFDVSDIEESLAEAESWFDERRNKKSWDFSSEVVDVRDNAFEADDLLRRLIEAIRDPAKSNLIVEGSIRDLGDYDIDSSLDILFTGRAVFASSSVEEIIGLGIAAFERGDYASALERAREARVLLVLERKGNFFLFVYLYWPFITLAIAILSFLAIVGYRKYRKVNVSNKIQSLNEEEKNVGKLLIALQADYFGGRLSGVEYKRILDQHEKRLANVRNARMRLRNMRLRILSSRRILIELRSEWRDVEGEIKRLQKAYYIKKGISESDYKTRFKILNERLAEIEGERATLQIMKKNGAKKRRVVLKKSRVAAKKIKKVNKMKKKRAKKAEREARKIIRKKKNIQKKKKKVAQKKKRAKEGGEMHDARGKKLKVVRRRRNK